MNSLAARTMPLPLPRTAREIRLARHPATDELPGPQHFAVVDAPLPQPAAGEVLLRNRWFRVPLSMRQMIAAGAKNVEGIPFPAFAVGDVLAGTAVGAVIDAPAGSGLVPGDWVMHGSGWREYAAVAATACTPLGRGEADPAGWLGHGWTAYAALTRGTHIRSGDTVFVSSGAGAIGSMAGQIARRLGAGRVVGSTGSTDKAAWMRAELGYDAVAIRGERPFAEALAEAAPGGIDVGVDMVGGEQLQAAVGAARDGARFVLLGALGAGHAGGAMPLAAVTLDSVALIVKGIALHGYSADRDAPAVFEEWLQRLAEWRRADALRLPCSCFSGIENAPTALHDACAGRLRGVVLVELP